MPKHYSTTIRIISTITLAVFFTTQAGLAMSGDARGSHIRSQAAGESSAASEVTQAMGAGAIGIIDKNLLKQIAQDSLVVVIGNHPDDVEFRQGGIIRKLADNGAEISIAILNSGVVEFTDETGNLIEKGVISEDYHNIREYSAAGRVRLKYKARLRKQEAVRGAIAMGLTRIRAMGGAVKIFNFGAGDNRHFIAAADHAERFEEVMGPEAREAFIAQCKKWLGASSKQSVVFIIDNNQMYPHLAHDWATENFIPQAISEFSDVMQQPVTVWVGGVEAGDSKATHFLPITEKEHADKKNALSKHQTQHPDIKLFGIMDEFNKTKPIDVDVKTPYVERYFSYEVRPSHTNTVSVQAMGAQEPSVARADGGIDIVGRMREVVTYGILSPSEQAKRGIEVVRSADYYGREQEKPLGQFISCNMLRVGRQEHNKRISEDAIYHTDKGALQVALEREDDAKNGLTTDMSQEEVETILNERAWNNFIILADPASLSESDKDVLARVQLDGNMAHEMMFTGLLPASIKAILVSETLASFAREVFPPNLVISVGKGQPRHITIARCADFDWQFRDVEINPPAYEKALAEYMNNCAPGTWIVEHVCRLPVSDSAAGSSVQAMVSGAQVAAVSILKKSENLPRAAVIIGDGTGAVSAQFAGRGFEIVPAVNEADAAGKKAQYEQAGYFVAVINAAGSVPILTLLGLYQPVEITDSNAVGRYFAGLAEQDV